MRNSAITWTLRFSTMTMFVMLGLLIYIPFISANTLTESEVPAFKVLRKRDIGLQMACKIHPRNCPGGYVLKRNRFPGTLLNREPSLSLRVDDLEPVQADMTAKEDLTENVRTLKYQLMDLLRPYTQGSSDERADEWSYNNHVSEE